MNWLALLNFQNRQGRFQYLSGGWVRGKGVLGRRCAVDLMGAFIPFSNRVLRCARASEHDSS